MGKHRFQYLFILLITAACSSMVDLGGNTQSLQKLTATPFISKLNGSTTKTMAINLGSGAHIAWMGFDFSGDYNYFKLNEYSINGVVTENEGGNQDMLADISLAPTASATGTTNSGQILLTFRYKPTKAINSESVPHTADFIIVTDEAAPVMIRLKLNGYTQGICDPTVENCSSVDITGLTVSEYELSVNHDPEVDEAADFPLYLCGPIIKNIGQDNDPDHASTNLAYIPVDGNLTFYISPDESEVHFVRADTGGFNPTIPLFDIPVPPGNYGLEIGEGTFLTAGLTDEQDFTCPMTDGIFTCEGLELQIDLQGGSIQNVVGISTGLTLTNGSTTPSGEKMDCNSFDEGLTGSGSLALDANNPPDENGTEITLVGWGVIDESTYVADLVGAVVVVEIPLKKAAE